MSSRQRQRLEYVTARQKRKLIELMTKYPQIISFKFTQGFNHRDSQQLWQNVANECNAIPGAKKNWRQWRKTWQDIKSRVKKQISVNGEVPSYVTMLTAAEQEALGFKNVSSTTNDPDTEQLTEFVQESTEFVPLDQVDVQDHFDNEDDPTASYSEPESPPEEKVFTRSHEKEKKIKSSKTVNSKHLDNCVFNCDLLSVQEQKKLQIKEDYYSFKKDYLKQKLMLMREQTEALKNIAKELAK